MSSEAAAYFSNAITTDSRVRKTVHSASSTLSDTNKDLCLPIDESQNTIQTAGPSDELLLQQVNQGTKDSLGILFRRHARIVRNVAYRILRNDAEADDLVQEVFLFIFRGTAVFDARQATARSWIIQMAYHRAIERRRYLNSRHFYTTQELEDTVLHTIDTPHLEFHEQTMEGILGKEAAARFSSRLSPEQQETIQLYFFEGYTLKEIAERTGHSLVNVRHQYYRGLERLRKYVLPESLRSK